MNTVVVLVTETIVGTVTATVVGKAVETVTVWVEVTTWDGALAFTNPVVWTPSWAV